MSLTRRIAHNTFFQIFGKVVSTLLGLIALGMITRYLGQVGFGHYTTIMTVLQFFGMLIDLGLYIIVIKYISDPQCDADRVMSNIFTLRIVTSVVFLGLAPLVSLFLPYPTIVHVGILVTAASFLFISLTQILLGVFQKHLVTYQTSLAEIAGRIILVTITGVTIYFHGNLLLVMFCVVAGSFTQFLITFLFAKKYIRIHLAFDFVLWKKILQETWPVAFSIVFNLIYFKADTLILSLVQPVYAVGIYGAAYKVLEVLITFPAMFAGLLLPLLSQAFAQHDMERFRRYLQEGFNAMTIIALPMLFTLLIFAEDVMVLVSGTEFTQAALPLRLLAFATTAIFLGSLFGHTIVVIRQQKTMLWVYAGVAFSFFFRLFLFYSFFSYVGAAAVTIFAEGSIMFAVMFVVLRTTRVRFSYRVFLKSLVASMIMGALVYVLRSTLLASSFGSLWIHKNFILQSLTLLILLGFGGFIYLVLLYFFRGFTKTM